MTDQHCNCPSLNDIFRGHVVGTKDPCPIHPTPEFLPGTFVERIQGPIVFAPLPDAMTDERADA